MGLLILKGDCVMLDYVGKYATDDDGNILPSEESVVAKFVGHDGTRIWLQSPTGDSTDSLVFTHFVGSSAQAIARMFDGKMVRIHRKMQHDNNAQMWGYFNTVEFA